MARLLQYVAGLMVLAIGVSFAAASGLGVSTLTALPFVISRITGLEFGTVTGLMFCFYVFLEWLILNKDFRMLQLLQIPCAILFGFLVSAAGALISAWHIDNYFESFFAIVLSILFTGTGIVIYLGANLVPQAADGLVQAIMLKSGKSLPFVKNIFDLVSVALAVIISLLFLGSVEGVREGTLLAAICVGRVISILQRFSSKQG